MKASLASLCTASLLFFALTACSGGTQILGNGDGGSPSSGDTETSDDVREPSDDDEGTTSGGSSDNDGPPANLDGKKRVFATASSYSGNLGGLSGADKKCQQAADGANLGGTWTALLASRNVGALERVKDVGPWYLVGSGAKIFNNAANLGTKPLAPLWNDEQGTRNIFDGSAWLGGEHGESSDEDCSAWRSASDGESGHAASLNDLSSYANGCSDKLRLICLEQ